MKRNLSLKCFTAVTALLPALYNPTAFAAAPSSTVDPASSTVRDADAPVLERQAELLAREIETLARRHENLAQRQVELAQAHALELPRLFAQLDSDAFPDLPEPPPAPLLPFGPKPPASVLMLQSTTPASTDPAALQEDLLVMTRVLERATGDQLEPVNPVRAMGLNLMNWSPVGPWARTVYLEDYGVLFNLQVRFPLLPPAPKSAATTPEPNPDDSEWEAARRDLYGPSGHSSRRAVPHLRIQQTLDIQTEAYDEGKVKKLQETLLRSLKQASRIRGLQPTDHLLICVQGPAADPTDVLTAREVRTEVARTPHDPVSQATHTVVTALSSPPKTGGTLMTLRVTKADVDAFAEGTLDFEAFQSRAQVRIYPGGTSPAQGLIGF